MQSETLPNERIWKIKKTSRNLKPEGSKELKAFPGTVAFPSRFYIGTVAWIDSPLRTFAEEIADYLFSVGNWVESHAF